MRKELIEIEKIESYLMQNMADTDRNAFELEIQSNTQLKAKVNAQQTVMMAIEQLSLKQSVKKAYKTYRLKVKLIRFFIITTILALTGALAFGLYYINNPEYEGNSEYNTTTFPINDSLSGSPNQFLQQEIFTINTLQDTIIENHDGVIVYIPEKAFDTDETEVQLMVQSAIQPEDIMLSGLSTTTNGKLLETGGMFYLDASVGGKSVKLNKPINVNVPTNNKIADMALYQGEKTETGEINWVEPKPLRKDLQPVDILSLDFYPPDYEDTMNCLSYFEKNFIDSVYYSFAFEESRNDTIGILYEQELELTSDEPVTQNNLSLELPPDSLYLPGNVNDVINWSINKEYLGNNIYEITMVADQIGGWHIYSQNQPLGGVSAPTTFNFHVNSNYKRIGLVKEFGTELHNGKFPERVFPGNKAIFKQKIQVNGSFDLIIDYSFTACLEACFPPASGQFTIHLDALEIDDTIAFSLPGINPASIKTIWSTDFNNTILATKAFEERMPWIHQSCNQSVLEFYINNLDKDLSTIDSLVIPLVSGEVKSKFIEFVKRGDGGVNMNSTAAKRLSNYFKRKQKLLAKALQQTQSEFWAEQSKKSDEFRKNETESMSRSLKNSAEVFQKEFNKNLCKVYEEVNYPRDCNDVPVPSPSTTYYQAEVTNLGWCNIDRQVYAATASRQSATINYNGKTSSLTYHEWAGIVENHEDYNRIYVYNIPEEFNSYVKLSGSKGRYDYSLNADMKYQTIVLGWTETDLFYAQKSSETGEQVFSLKAISEDEFKNKIQSRLKSINNMEAELDFIHQSQIDQKRINANNERIALRTRVQPVIFPCYQFNDEIDLSSNTTIQKIVSIGVPSTDLPSFNTEPEQISNSIKDDKQE